MGAEQSVPERPLEEGAEQLSRNAAPSALVIVGPSGVGKGTLINRRAVPVGGLALHCSRARLVGPCNALLTPSRSGMQADGVGQAVRLLMQPHHAAAAGGRSGEHSEG